MKPQAFAFAATAALLAAGCAATQPTDTSLAPTKPTQSINSVQGGDRLNNTQPTDTTSPSRR